MTTIQMFIVTLNLTLVAMTSSPNQKNKKPQLWSNLKIYKRSYLTLRRLMTKASPANLIVSLVLQENQP